MFQHLAIPTADRFLYHAGRTLDCHEWLAEIVYAQPLTGRLVGGRRSRGGGFRGALRFWRATLLRLHRAALRPGLTSMRSAWRHGICLHAPILWWAS